MKGLLLAFTLLVVPATVDDEERKPAPDPKVVEATVADLEEAFEEGELKDRVNAIERGGEVHAPEVVAWMAKAVKQTDEPEVRHAALAALRWMDHPDAFEVLEKTVQRDKKLRKDIDLYVALLKGIAQHGARGEEDAIELLVDYSVKDSTGRTVEARIYGLGLIRDKRSVEGLFKLMRSFGPKRVDPRMDQFQLALVILAGDDFGGRSRERWVEWWKKHEKKHEVSPEPPKLPAEWQKRWNRYWDREVEYVRPTRRRERGGGE